MVPASMMGTGAMGGYASKVLSYGPIAYWPLWEATGATAQCLVNPAQNGTAVGVTWANDITGSFGTPAPFFDGANDYVNIYSAALSAALDGLAGTLMIWAKVANVGVWTDAVTRNLFRVVDTDDWNELIYIDKRDVVNTMRWSYTANAVTDAVSTGGWTSVAWVCFMLTWDSVADQLKAYADGTQQGVTQNTLGVWAGAIDTAVIGASTIVPNAPYHGWLAHCAVWDRALGAGAITALANP